MKKYNLKLLTYVESYDVSVYSTHFYSSDNHYSFYDNQTLVACYPISKTIIVNIEEIEEDCE